jgi:hypothetical protein
LNFFKKLRLLFFKALRAEQTESNKRLTYIEDRRGRTAENCQNKTARAGRRGQDSQGKAFGTGHWDRTDGSEDGQNIAPRTGLGAGEHG